MEPDVRKLCADIVDFIVNVGVSRDEAGNLDKSLDIVEVRWGIYRWRKATAILVLAREA